MAERPALRVLFTSGYAFGAVHAPGRAVKGIPMLTKPYRKADLRGCCAVALIRPWITPAIQYRRHIPFSPN